MYLECAVEEDGKIVGQEQLRHSALLKVFPFA